MKLSDFNLRHAILAFGVGAFVAACTSAEDGKSDSEAVVGINTSYIDSTVRPSDDFFRFVNGKWIDQTEIPGDQGRWGSFNELREMTNETVLSVLETAGKSNKYGEGTDQKKATDFYAIGMDSLLAERVGAQPLQPYFDKIGQISDAGDLQKYLSEQQTYGGGAFFNFAVFPDLKNSKVMATYLGQGGLGLPDRDYYTKIDSKSQEIRDKYVKHIARMLTLAGDEPQMAADQAARIMALETRLAEASMTNVERRNIPALYNKRSLTELAELAPSIDWGQYLEDMDVTGIDTLIVMQPEFIAEFQKITEEVPVAVWKEYLRWRLVDGTAGFLSNEFVQANFEFYSKELRGVEEMQPRWKRVLATTNGSLGEAIGKLYVDEKFPPEAKTKAQEMVENIKLAFADRIKKLDWMSDSTKEKALEKLKTMTVKIGYPDEWRDYSGLMVEGDPEKSSYIQNVLNASKFGFEYQISKIGKPVDKKEWGMSPQTVNAYFNPLFNEIVFPAAILQPPFYNYKADMAVNYGGIGAVIGHEISHCFDDQGSRFDAEGNLKNWWTEKDAESFKARTGQLVAQYDAYEPLDSVRVNGAFTLGENIGDLGGVSAAYDGLQRHLAEHGNPGLIDGMTPEQRFFVSWATIWRIKYKNETLRTQVNTDPHSPGMYRANGPLANLETFYQAFNVQPGDGMYRADSVRVKIW
ncbi:Peptidase, M13 family [Fulvivirga imtechensis AK7]|uniref:Peptidase, M13 family n=1 Tax=Fulvivirga imtechensis AK7 TaxID=1237149 RepID=L8JU92_9BACT|nr:M13 family metallopeptidase [Fulvivirga imtechensis]ELR70862.1 Peptidase, M13 family [Fulvivirga imtechensis AK7]